MELLNELKKRFATLETIEGTTYLALGAALFLSNVFGLIQLAVSLVPFAAIILIAAGAYKTFVKRDDKK